MMPNNIRLGGRLKDGGSQEIVINKQSYWIDNRIRSKTKGHVYIGSLEGRLAPPLTASLVVKWYNVLRSERYRTPRKSKDRNGLNRFSIRTGKEFSENTTEGS